MGIVTIWTGAAIVLVSAWAAGLYLFGRLIINPKRHIPWSDPKKELGLDFEEVRFPARDGLRVAGLVPTQRRFEGYMALVDEPRPIIDFFSPLIGRPAESSRPSVAPIASTHV